MAATSIKWSKILLCKSSKSCCKLYLPLDFGLIAGIVYDNDLEGAENINGAIFFTIVTQPFISTTGSFFVSSHNKEVTDIFKVLYTFEILILTCFT